MYNIAYFYKEIGRKNSKIKFPTPGNCQIPESNLVIIIFYCKNSPYSPIYIIPYKKKIVNNLTKNI